MMNDDVSMISDKNLSRMIFIQKNNYVLIIDQILITA